MTTNLTRRPSHRLARLVLLAALGLAPVLLVSGCGGGEAKRAAAGTGPDPKESPADLYVELAAEYLRRGQLDAALDRAVYALEQDRKSPRAHYMLAIVQQQLGRTAEAERAFAEAVRMDPDNPDYRNAWGAVLCRQGRYEEALREIERAGNDPLNQNAAMAFMNAADCAGRARRTGQVDGYLRAALGRDPNFPPALLALAERDYERGSYQEARERMLRYGRLAPPTPAALLLAARIERKLGKADNARVLENMLRERFPNAPEALQL